MRENQGGKTRFSPLQTALRACIIEETDEEQGIAQGCLQRAGEGASPAVDGAVVAFRGRGGTAFASVSRDGFLREKDREARAFVLCKRGGTAVYCPHGRKGCFFIPGSNAARVLPAPAPQMI